MITATIDNEMLGRLLAIERCRERFRGVKLPFNLTNRLRKSSMKKSSFASTRIEGNPLSEEQAAAAIDSSRRRFLRPEQEVRNYFEALKFLERALAKKTAFSKRLVLDVQRIVVRGESAEKSGFREAMPPGVLFAVYDEATGRPEYIPPESGEVERLIDELVDYVSGSDDHPVVKAAIVHYQMVTIHPFEDGNGRTARLLSDYILDLGGYGFSQIGSLEEYFAYDIGEYYRSLQMGLPPLYYDGRDNPPHPEIWIGYFLRMMELHARKVVDLAGQTEKARTNASLSFLSPKERELLEHLKRKDIRIFRPIDLANTFKVSNRTIINWCADLARNGFLEPSAIGQRIRSYIVCDHVFA